MVVGTSSTRWFHYSSLRTTPKITPQIGTVTTRQQGIMKGIYSVHELQCEPFSTDYLPRVLLLLLSGLVCKDIALHTKGLFWRCRETDGTSESQLTTDVSMCIAKPEKQRETSKCIGRPPSEAVNTTSSMMRILRLRFLTSAYPKGEGGENMNCESCRSDACSDLFFTMEVWQVQGSSTGATANSWPAVVHSQRFHTIS